MKSVKLLFIVLLKLVSALEIKQEESVYILEDSNAKEFIQKEEYVFVKFYAPWCGHCKHMAPAYKSLAEQFHQGDSKVKIAKLDATVHKSFAEEHGIEGFPTIKLFINGKPIDYSGERTKDAMATFINKKVNQGTKIIHTSEELKNFRAQKISVLIVLPEENTNDMKAAQQLTNQYEDIEVAVLLDSNLLDKKPKSKKTLILFRNFDDGDKELNLGTEIDVNVVNQFVNAHKFPIVMEFDQEAANRIFGEKLETFFFFDDNLESDGVKEFKAFAKQQLEKGEKMVFSVSKVGADFGQRLAEYLGVQSGHQGVIIRFNEKESLDKFRVENVSAKGLKNALEEYRAGKLKAYYKSAKIPAKNDEPVVVVVGDNFDEIVLKSNRFVLLEAYAPWCGHCKSLEPIYKELAEKFAPFKDSLTIAKFEATANEHPKMPVSGFPTIRLFKPNVEQPVDYSGDRSLQDLIGFIQKETGIQIQEKKEEMTTEEL